MRNAVIGSIVLLAMAGTACNKEPQPLEQPKATQEADAGGKTQGPAMQPRRAPKEVGAGDETKGPLEEPKVDPAGGLDVRVAGKTKGPAKETTFDLGNGVTMDFVLIHPSTFMMGSDEGGDATPVHKVTITKPFYLAKYPVTQEQWEAVMGNNPSKFKGTKNPVENVSWDDCQAFCAKLAASYRGTFRLPTEAQWEYACRAGSTGKYCYGDDKNQLGEYAWYSDNSGRKTHPVGEKKANAWGLYDMHGNVMEWCQDWYDADYYARSPTDDPAGPVTGSDRAIDAGARPGLVGVLPRSQRVTRGVGWNGTAAFCGSADRGNGSPRDRDSTLGFRISRVLADK